MKGSKASKPSAQDHSWAAGYCRFKTNAPAVIMAHTDQRRAKAVDLKALLADAKIAEWVTAVATFLTAVVALWMAIREARLRRRELHVAQAEQIAAWLDVDRTAEETGITNCVVMNGSNQVIYNVIISVVGVHGAFRKTAVGVDRNSPRGGYQTYVGGAFPPGKQTFQIRYPGSRLQVRYGVELTFRDCGGRYWIRSGTGVLREVKKDPLILYGSGPPGPGPGGIQQI
jgi:hypothetical protein